MAVEGEKEKTSKHFIELNGFFRAYDKLLKLTISIEVPDPDKGMVIWQRTNEDYFIL